MKSVDYPEPFQALVRELRRLPSIGPRSAERIALWLTSARNSNAKDLANALEVAATTIAPCEQCGFFSTTPTCQICQDETRTGKEICVVETSVDILPIERTGSFHGLYHALGGRLAPLDNVGPDDLRIDALVHRVQSERPTEIILALSADVEGEATCNYLTDILTSSGISITRLAQGLPAGGGLEHADALTLQRAFAGRRAASQP